MNIRADRKRSEHKRGLVRRGVFCGTLEQYAAWGSEAADRRLAREQHRQRAAALAAKAFPNNGTMRPRHARTLGAPKKHVSILDLLGPASLLALAGHRRRK